MWGPSRIGVFRALWLGVLVSNIGLWMQTVGASGCCCSRRMPRSWVALVQTADATRAWNMARWWAAKLM
jgi:hypothetical protein